MTDPDDRKLLEFVAAFAGWTNLREHPESGHFIGTDPHGFYILCTDYTKTLDGWHRDVWPKISADHKTVYVWHGTMVNDYERELGQAGIMNATARQRCLALYRALDGKLTTEGGPQ